MDLFVELQSPGLWVVTNTETGDSRQIIFGSKVVYIVHLVEKEDFLMADKHPATEHHHKAAEHHTKAAEHHKKAAELHEAGKHEEAAHHTTLAHGHLAHATEHMEHAVKKSVEHHEKNKK